MTRRRRHEDQPALPRKRGMVKWKIVHDAPLGPLCLPRGRVVVMRLLRKYVAHRCVGAKAGKPVWELAPFGRPRECAEMVLIAWPNGVVHLRMFGHGLGDRVRPAHVEAMARWAFQAEAMHAGHMAPQDRQNGWAAARVFAGLYAKARNGEAL